MNQQFSAGQNPLSFTLRDLAAIGFRRKRVLAFCFFGICLGVILATLAIPAKYKAETKLLVEKGRMDPVVTPEQTAPMMFRDTVTEEELNSEIELIESQDVLRKVVLDNGLDHRKSLLGMLDRWQSDQARIAKAVARLRSGLVVELVKKTDLISITYESESPELAARVLRTLNDAYIQKHLEVHHPQGQVKFFEQETEQYRKALADAEQNLKEFSDQGGVSPAEVRDQTLDKLAEFNSTLASTRADIASTERRIQDLESQQKSTPSRLTTQMKKGDNAQVLETLKSTLMTLELKRTELLTKYQPSYPLVTEVDKQITDTKTALAKEEGTFVNEETTDQNPTYSWINEELAKAKSDLSGMQARETATQAIVELYNNKAKMLDEKGLKQQDLLRTQKANEDNYLLYLKKGEEARIAAALDQNKILNVAIAEPPIVPALPSRSAWTFALVGCLLASVVSMGLAITVDYTDRSFRTPSEVSAELNIPVLAAVPFHSNGNNGSNGSNGKNGHNGNGHNGSNGRGIDGAEARTRTTESDTTPSDKY